MLIQPKSRSDQGKQIFDLHNLMEEDPIFEVTTNIEIGQMLIAGIDQLHLDIIRDYLFYESRIDTMMGRR
jgi:elongation factor G